MRLQRRVLLAGLAVLPWRAQAAGRVNIVAAENMYGDIAGQIGGNFAAVTSILNNPNQDPHLFAASPSVARNLAAAQIVILNGADYDPWMAGLLAAQPTPGRIVISVADLLGRKPGDNPHLWYDSAAAPLLTAQLVAALVKLDPANATAYRANGTKLLASLAPIHARIAAMRRKIAGTKVTATEPVYGLMAQALGLDMLNLPFQIAVMNGTEPAPSDVAAFEGDLQKRVVKALFYNSQVTDDLTSNLLTLAHQAGVPVVGVTETEPAGLNYQAWLNNGLDNVDQALLA
jgi:zinc/manganese transport system substrate-binding protein